MIDPIKYQTEFETTAKSLGWPQAIIDQISVEITLEGIKMNYPPELHEEIENLEYGNFSSPKAAMRNTTARIGKDAASQVLKKITEDEIKKSVLK